MSWKRLFDDLMEAATFAEADQPETARAIASRIFPEERAHRAARILAVSGTTGFSPSLVERSVAMAARLDYGLVAMTAGSAGSPGRRVSGRRDLTGEAFAARAAERGVPFSHVTWPGNPRDGVAEAARRLRRIAFLLVEADLVPLLSAARGGIPVFRLEE